MILDGKIIMSSRLVGFYGDNESGPVVVSPPQNFAFLRENSATVEGDSDLTFTWSALSNILSYRIGYKLSTAADYTYLTETAATTIDLLELDDGTYDFIIQARYFSGYGDASALLNQVIAFGLEYFRTKEVGAQAHYVFGDDNVGLTDLDGLNALTLNGDAPTLSTGYLRTAAGDLNGLLTPIVDKAVDQTFLVVIRTDRTTERGMLFGSQPPGDVSKGSICFTNFTNTSLIMRHGGTANKTISHANSLGVWVMLGYSVFSGNVAYYYQDSNGNRYVGEQTPKTASTLFLCIGNQSLTNYDLEQDVAETIIFDSGKTHTEIDAIFLRSQQQLIDRGIDLDTA